MKTSSDKAAWAWLQYKRSEVPDRDADGEQFVDRRDRRAGRPYDGFSEQDEYTDEKYYNG